MKVRGQISLLNGSSISFGLSDYPVSEFELVAEELLMSFSIIKVINSFVDSYCIMHAVTVTVTVTFVISLDREKWSKVPIYSSS